MHHNTSSSHIDFVREDLPANIFELILLASKRARQLSLGTSKALVPTKGDKETVVALREISLGIMTEKILTEEQAKIDQLNAAKQAALQAEKLVMNMQEIHDDGASSH